MLDVRVIFVEKWLIWVSLTTKNSLEDVLKVAEVVSQL